MAYGCRLVTKYKNGHTQQTYFMYGPSDHDDGVAFEMARRHNDEKRPVDWQKVIDFGPGVQE